MRNVEAKGPVRVVFNELDRVPIDERRHIALFVGFLILMPPIECARPIDVRKEINVAADIAPEEIEPVAHRVVVRVVAEVPFAHDSRGVALVFQHFRKRVLDRLQSVALGFAFGVGEDHNRDAGPLLIAAGKQRRPRWAAYRAIRMEVGEFESLSSEAINRRHIDPAAISAQVAVPEIVSHDDDEVGRLLGSFRRRRRPGTRKKEQNGDCGGNEAGRGETIIHGHGYGALADRVLVYGRTAAPGMGGQPLGVRVLQKSFGSRERQD